MDTNSILPFIAIIISVIARIIFMYLLYVKKSTNNYSLIFCGLNICSSILWIYYSIVIKNFLFFIRSLIDLVLFSISSLYIIYNKIKEHRQISIINL